MGTDNLCGADKFVLSIKLITIGTKGSDMKVTVAKYTNPLQEFFFLPFCHEQSPSFFQFKYKN